MPKPKYNIKEIKKRQNKDYPVDINEDAENLAKYLDDPKLSEYLNFLKTKPWYGEYLHYDKNGIVDAKFEIDKGIVRSMKPVKVFDERNVFVMNILNKKIYSEKEGHEEPKEN